MYLFIRRATRQICDASNIEHWSNYLTPEMEIREVAGDAETYPWPNGDRVRAVYNVDGSITGDPAWVDVDALRDAYVEAKAAITVLAADGTIPVTAKQAVVKLGVCVEELLKFLNRRIS